MKVKIAEDEMFVTNSDGEVFKINGYMCVNKESGQTTFYKLGSKMCNLVCARGTFHNAEVLNDKQINIL